MNVKRFLEVTQLDYQVRKIKGSFHNDQKYQELVAMVDEMNEAGYRLHSVTPQEYNGVTEANVLIFYKED